MKNNKTTWSGIISILVAIGSAVVEFLNTGSVPNLGVLISAISAGAGLIMAKDATPSK